MVEFIDAEKLIDYKYIREDNFLAMARAFSELQIADGKMKVNTRKNARRSESVRFEELFDYTSINISGLNLEKDDMKAKYVILIGIKWDTKLKKNKSYTLFYFGAVADLDKNLNTKIFEFVYRWRLENTFRLLDEQYEKLQKALKKGL